MVTMKLKNKVKVKNE